MQNDQWVNSCSSFTWPFCAFFFFCQLLCIFQLAGSSPSTFPYTTSICFVKRQFTFHHIMWRNARQEGRGTKQWFLWQLENPPSLVASSFFSDHYNRWTVVGVSVYKGINWYFDWQYNTLVHIGVYLTFFWEQICWLVSLSFGGWLFRSRAAVVSVNQSTGPEGKDGES